MALIKWSDNIAATALQGNYDGYIQSSLLQLRLTGAIGSNPANGTAVYNISENTTYKVRLYMDTRFRVAACSSIAMNTVMTNYYRDPDDKSDTTVAGAYKETEITSEAGQVYMPVVYWASGGSKTWSEVYDTIEVRKQLTGTLELTMPPTKTQYNVGEELDLTGMVVSVVWSDGTKEAVTDYTVSGYDGSVAGTCTVVVTYQGETVSFEVTVAAASHILREYIGSPNLEDVVAELDTETWVMTISGTGAIRDFSDSDVMDTSGGMPSVHPPIFKEHFMRVKEIVVEEGVTAIGGFFFVGYASEIFMTVAMDLMNGSPVSAKMEDCYIALEKIKLAESVTSLNTFAFAYSCARKEIDLGGVQNAPENSFMPVFCPLIRSKLSESGVMSLRIRNQVTFGLILPGNALYDTESGFGYVENDSGLTVIGKSGVLLYADEANVINIPEAYSGSPVTSVNDFLGFPMTNGSVINVPNSVTLVAQPSFNTLLRGVSRTINIDGIEGSIDGPWDNYDDNVVINWLRKAQIIGIEITSLPTKLSYVIGDELDSTGLVVNANYDEGTSMIITDYILSGFDSTTAGTKTITVAYQGFTVTFEVTVTEADKHLVGVSVTAMPTKTQYLIGEEFDSTGLVVSATYSDGTTEVTADYTLSNFDSTTAGSKTVTVTYQGLTESFEIWVHDASTILTEYIGSKSKDIVATLYTSTGLVEISGKGGMKDFGSELSLFQNKKSSIKSIVISPGVTSIGRYAFYNCTGLTDIAIPDSVKSIGWDAFMGCASLKDIRLPSFLTTIDMSTFYNCTSLTDITIPDSVRSIGIHAFHGCTGLTNIIIPNSVKSMEDYAFMDCTGLINITIPESVTSIGVSAFKGCTGLTNVTIPGATSIKESVFSGCTGIASVTIPRVTEIGETVFEGCTGLTNITIPETVTSIGRGCFTGCIGLTNITIPDSVTELGQSAFESCSGLTDITIPNNVLSIERYTFRGCTSLTRVTIPDTVTVIKMFAFNGCASLTNITIPGTVTEIWQSVFDGCTSLTNITIPESVTIIESFTFRNCTSLTDITIPDSVKSIGVSAFDGCIGLTTMTIPESVTTIGRDAFNGCTGLTTITIPNSVKSIDSGCFTGCVLLARIDIRNTQDSIPGTPWGAPNATVNWLVAITLESVLNTTKGMKAIRNNVKNDDGTDTVTGVDWFMYDGRVCSNIYVSGNNWIGFGASTEHLKICRRDGAVYYVYRQESVLDNGAKFLKIRVEGYTYISGTDVTRKLVYELFLFDNNDMFLNIITSPTYSSHVGTSSITCNGITTALNIPVNATANGPLEISFINKDDKGKEWDIVYVPYSFNSLSGIKILCLPDKMKYIIGEELDISGMLVCLVYNDGSEEAFVDYVLSGFDSTTVGTKTITVTYQGFTATFEIIVYEVITGIRIAHYPDKVYYKINDALDTTGLHVVGITEEGMERTITDYTLSELDSSTVGNKQITVTYEVPVSGNTTAVYFVHFNVRVTATGDNPFEGTEPLTVAVHWPNGEFTDLTNADLAGGTGAMTLQESICSDNYFIYGGCVSNMLKFTTHSAQFLSTEESAYPHGDIEVYVECKGTRVKIFTGTIASGKRNAGLTQREIIAYDYLYKFRNTDIAWWYKNKTTDKQMLLTQKQFREELFAYLGIEQVPTKLYYDDAFVPNTNVSAELNAVRIIKDMCLQNNVFGWINRDGRFEYLKLTENSREKSHDNAGNITYEYFPATVYVDNYESCDFTEGRIWYPTEFYSYPEPNYGFSSGPPNAQEAYDRNVYYNRNSFFIGNADWLDSAWQVNEYNIPMVDDPIFPICFGPFADIFRLYRAQGYNVTVRGNPLNKVGDTIEITVRKTADDGTQLEWVIHSYIMSRTLKLLGDTSMYDTYSARNAPYNGNNTQAGTYVPELSAEMFRARAEGPVISYADFDDGASALTAGSEEKKVRFRCAKKMAKAGYEALRASGRTRKDTMYGVQKG